MQLILPMAYSYCFECPSFKHICGIYGEKVFFNGGGVPLVITGFVIFGQVSH